MLQASLLFQFIQFISKRLTLLSSQNLTKIGRIKENDGGGELNYDIL
jgi:hypothetical protein